MEWTWTHPGSTTNEPRVARDVVSLERGLWFGHRLLYPLSWHHTDFLFEFSGVVSEEGGDWPWRSPGQSTTRPCYGEALSTQHRAGFVHARLAAGYLPTGSQASSNQVRKRSFHSRLRQCTKCFRASRFLWLKHPPFCFNLVIWSMVKILWRPMNKTACWETVFLRKKRHFAVNSKYPWFIADTSWRGEHCQVCNGSASSPTWKTLKSMSRITTWRKTTCTELLRPTSSAPVIRPIHCPSTPKQVRWRLTIAICKKWNIQRAQKKGLDHILWTYQDINSQYLTREHRAHSGCIFWMAICRNEIAQVN